MNETGNPLAAWESFYVIVGSSGAALIGMQFVVMTLIAERRRLARSETIGAYGTPTVVHLTVSLVIAAVMSAPWPSLRPIGAAALLCGLSGLVYAVVVFARARKQTDYKPVWQDWFWYTVIPSVCYIALTATSAFISSDTTLALFIIGGSSLGLLLIGVHNAWDSITHIVITGAGSGSA